MNKENASFLVIGGGSIGKRHIRNLKTLGYSNIYCLKRTYDATFESEEQVKVITSIDELPANIDAVFVCSPTSLHGEGISIARRLNAAIFMEKPLIHNNETLEEIKSRLGSYPKPFFIGFMLRYHPLVQEIRSVIASGKIGEVYSARFSFGSYLPYWHPWEDHKDSYASKKELGGGVINTITHELDLVQFFFGQPQSIVASKRNVGRLGIEVEEVAEAILEYNDKLVSLHLDYLQKDYDRNIQILGDHGSITWNWHENKVVVKIHKAENVSETPLTGFNVNDLYISELEHFITLVTDNTPDHPLDFNHAVANTRLMLAIHKAADSGNRQLIN